MAWRCIRLARSMKQWTHGARRSESIPIVSRRYVFSAASTFKYMPSEAILAFERAVAIKPGYAEAQAMSPGIADRRPARRGAARRRPCNSAFARWAEPKTNKIMAMNYVASISNADISATAGAFGSQFDQPDPSPHTIGDLMPERRLRIGYVSGDLILHPVGFFLAPALAGAQQEAFEIFCYSNNAKTDEMTDACGGPAIMARHPRSLRHRGRRDDPAATESTF